MKRAGNDVEDQAEWKRDDSPNSIEKFWKSLVDRPKRQCNDVENKSEGKDNNPPKSRKEFTHLFLGCFRLVLILMVLIVRSEARSCSRTAGWALARLEPAGCAE